MILTGILWPEEIIRRVFWNEKQHLQGPDAFQPRSLEFNLSPSLFTFPIRFRSKQFLIFWSRCIAEKTCSHLYIYMIMHWARIAIWKSRNCQNSLYPLPSHPASTHKSPARRLSLYHGSNTATGSLTIWTEKFSGFFVGWWPPKRLIMFIEHSIRSRLSHVYSTIAHFQAISTVLALDKQCLVGRSAGKTEWEHRSPEISSRDFILLRKPQELHLLTKCISK